jgi:Na+/melibiose symporter-like transporter
VIVAILRLARRVDDPLPAEPDRPFDLTGAVLSAAGMFLIVLGILQADRDAALMAVLMVAGAVFLAWFFLHVRTRERAGREPLLSLRLFRNRTSNLALVTQNLQWLIMMGTSFVVAVYLQTVRGYDAVQTGLIFTSATAGVLVSSLGAERFARRRAQRTLIIAGFAVTAAGIGVLLGLADVSSRIVATVPGLLLIGLGVGVMITPSGNVVQSTLAKLCS